MGRRALSRLLLAMLAAASILAANLAAQQTVVVTRDQVGGGVVVQGGGVGPGAVPPRDQGPPPTGTGRIRGRVVDATTGTALRRATLRLMAPEIRVQRSTQSDGNGRFEFDQLPAGRFTLNASKGGYIDMTYGQIAPMEPGRPIALADKQVIDTVSLSMTRGGIITGRVLDEFGEPLPEVMVMAMRFQNVNGRRQPMPFGRSDSTNDIGEFRLYGLPPGQFTVAATFQQRNFVMMDATVASASGNDRFGYAQTFYPSTANPAEAQTVTVEASQLVSDLAITLVSTRTAVVSGTAIDSTGAPIRQGMVMAMQTSSGFGGPGGNGPLRPDGTFTMSGLTPGTYMLRAMQPNQTPGAPQEVSVATVEVNGADVTGVVLAPLRPVTLEGRVILDAAAGTFRPQSVRITAQPAPGADRMMMMTMGAPQQAQSVRDDLSFTLSSMPGAVMIRANGLQPGWMVRAVRLNGRDITSGVTLSEGDRGELEVELSDRAPSLTGSITDSRGGIPAEASVIVFPQDEDQWPTMMPGQFAMARGDDGGRFTARGLRPGNYYIIAIDRLLTGQWTDPEFLARVRPNATRLTLQEGDVKTMDLRVAAAR